MIKQSRLLAISRRLRCESVVPTTQASVEAPLRSEGYDRAEKLRQLWALIYSLMYNHGGRSNRHAEGVAQTV